ncbi:murein transglycosylase [Thioploca ingrica]|uniref:Murein transglycosylase n=1 Tax=Thioploca ingrica TaxID=40754 RepID=A0A090AEZ4_9GAMM|nr:murein transglycosylase [Thioploca ingrica]
MKRLTLDPLCLFGMIMLAQILISPAQSSEIYSYVDTDGVRHYTDNHPSHRPTVKLYPQPTSQSTGSVKIYRFVDDDNVIHLTDNPKDSRYRLIYQGGSNVPSFTGNVYSGIDVSPDLHDKYQDYQNLVAEAASYTQLEPALLHAVIQTESAYNPQAVSPKGAVGLMQLMPATAKRFGVSDRTDATSNIYGGARYLRYLLGLFNNNLNLALAGYNAGENAVIRYGNQIPPYQETKSYVRRVLALYKSYQEQM